MRSVQFGLNISKKTHQGIDLCALPVLLTPLAPLGARPYLNRNCVRFGCVPHRKCTAAPSVVYDPARASKTKESKAHWC